MKRRNHFWNWGGYTPINKIASLGTKCTIPSDINISVNAKNKIGDTYTDTQPANTIIVKREYTEFLERIKISKNAIDMFCEKKRYMGQQVPSKPEVTLRKLLAKVLPKKLECHYPIKRSFNAINSGWRFVIVDGILVSVDRMKKGKVKR